MPEQIQWPIIQRVEMCHGTIGRRPSLAVKGALLDIGFELEGNLPAFIPAGRREDVHLPGEIIEREAARAVPSGIIVVNGVQLNLLRRAEVAGTLILHAPVDPAHGFRIQLVAVRIVEGLVYREPRDTEELHVYGSQLAAAVVEEEVEEHVDLLGRKVPLVFAVRAREFVGEAEFVPHDSEFILGDGALEGNGQSIGRVAERRGKRAVVVAKP